MSGLTRKNTYSISASLVCTCSVANSAAKSNRLRAVLVPTLTHYCGLLLQYSRWSLRSCATCHETLIFRCFYWSFLLLHCTSFNWVTRFELCLNEWEENAFQLSQIKYYWRSCWSCSSFSCLWPVFCGDTLIEDYLGILRDLMTLVENNINNINSEDFSRLSSDTVQLVSFFLRILVRLPLTVLW